MVGVGGRSCGANRGACGGANEGGNGGAQRRKKVRAEV